MVFASNLFAESALPVGPAWDQFPYPTIAFTFLYAQRQDWAGQHWPNDAGTTAPPLPSSTDRLFDRD